MPLPSPLVHASVAELTAQFQARNLSPVELLVEQTRRIDAHEPRLHAFTVRDPDAAMAAARASEARWQRGEALGPLDGVTFSAKDNFMVAGYPYRRGSLATPAAVVDETSPMVARLLEGGAVLVGLTSMPEFGAGAVTNSPLTGIARNPWNPACHAGGSSGGGVISVAAGMCTVALGSDAGGSIRIPSALSGTVGFKSTGGALPVYPASFVGNVSCPGPITRNVADARAVLAAAARPDARDPFALPGGLGAERSGTLPPLRIAFSMDMGYAPFVQPEVQRLVRQAAEVFSRWGCTLQERHPGTGSPLEVFGTLTRAAYRHTLPALGAEGCARLGPTLAAMLRDDADVSLSAHLQNMDRIHALGQRMQAFHEDFDLLILPTVAATAFDAELPFHPAFAQHGNPRAWTPFASLFNLTQQPVISVPVGLAADGLPVGMQIVGPRGADQLVLQAAQAYLEHTGPIALPPLP